MNVNPNNYLKKYELEKKKIHDQIINLTKRDFFHKWEVKPDGTFKKTNFFVIIFRRICEAVSGKSTPSSSSDIEKHFCKLVLKGQKIGALTLENVKIIQLAAFQLGISRKPSVQVLIDSFVKYFFEKTSKTYSLKEKRTLNQISTEVGGLASTLAQNPKENPEPKEVTTKEVIKNTENLLSPEPSIIENPLPEVSNPKKSPSFSKYLKGGAAFALSTVIAALAYYKLGRPNHAEQNQVVPINSEDKAPLLQTSFSDLSTCPIASKPTSFNNSSVYKLPTLPSNTNLKRHTVKTLVPAPESAPRDTKTSYIKYIASGLNILGGSLLSGILYKKIMNESSFSKEEFRYPPSESNNGGEERKLRNPKIKIEAIRDDPTLIIHHDENFKKALLSNKVAAIQKGILTDTYPLLSVNIEKEDFITANDLVVCEEGERVLKKEGNFLSICQVPPLKNFFIDEEAEVIILNEAYKKSPYAWKALTIDSALDLTKLEAEIFPFLDIALASGQPLRLQTNPPQLALTIIAAHLISRCHFNYDQVMTYLAHQNKYEMEDIAENEEILLREYIKICDQFRGNPPKELVDQLNLDLLPEDKDHHIHDLILKLSSQNKESEIIKMCEVRKENLSKVIELFKNSSDIKKITLDKETLIHYFTNQYPEASFSPIPCLFLNIPQLNEDEIASIAENLKNEKKDLFGLIKDFNELNETAQKIVTKSLFNTIESFGDHYIVDIENISKQNALFSILKSHPEKRKILLTCLAKYPEAFEKIGLDILTTYSEEIVHALKNHFTGFHGTNYSDESLFHTEMGKKEIQNIAIQGLISAPLNRPAPKEFIIKFCQSASSEEKIKILTTCKHFETLQTVIELYQPKDALFLQVIKDQPELIQNLDLVTVQELLLIEKDFIDYFPYFNQEVKKDPILSRALLKRFQNDTSQVMTTLGKIHHLFCTPPMLIISPKDTEALKKFWKSCGENNQDLDNIFSLDKLKDSLSPYDLIYQTLAQLPLVTERIVKDPSLKEWITAKNSLLNVSHKFPGKKWDEFTLAERVYCLKDDRNEIWLANLANDLQALLTQPLDFKAINNCLEEFKDFGEKVNSVFEQCFLKNRLKEDFKKTLLQNKFKKIEDEIRTKGNISSLSKITLTEDPIDLNYLADQKMDFLQINTQVENSLIEEEKQEGKVQEYLWETYHYSSQFDFSKCDKLPLLKIFFITGQPLLIQTQPPSLAPALIAANLIQECQVSYEEAVEYLSQYSQFVDLIDEMKLLYEKDLKGLQTKS